MLDNDRRDDRGKRLQRVVLPLQMLSVALQLGPFCASTSSSTRLLGHRLLLPEGSSSPPEIAFSAFPGDSWGRADTSSSLSLPATPRIFPGASLRPPPFVLVFPLSPSFLFTFVLYPPHSYMYIIPYPTHAGIWERPRPFAVLPSRGQQPDGPVYGHCG